MKACIIVLNYNGFSDTKECIDSIFENIKLEKNEIIVVDNGSSEDEIVLLRDLCENKKIHLIETHKNLGYAGGNNVGIQYAIAQKFDYICILNNDTIVVKDFLTPCMETLSLHHEVGFLGPAIIDYKTNTIQSTGGRIDILRGRVDLLNFSADPKVILKENRFVLCDYVGGACIICRTELIQEIGMIPESYFLFYEETEWCYKAIKHGYINLCQTNAVVLHKGSQSTSHYVGLQEYLMARNRVVFVKRNARNAFEFTIFFIYLILGNIKRCFINYKRFAPYFKYYLDGLTGKVDTKYPFVICKEKIKYFYQE